MRRGTLTLLFFIILLTLGASFVVFWPNTATNAKPLYGINNPFTIHEGLDLKGGIQVLLVPKAGQDTSDANMDAARIRIEQRVNGGLGVNEPSIRIQKTNGQPSISIELPGFSGNQQQAINNLLKTGTLEFWNTGQTSLPEGSTLNPASYAQYNPGGKALFTGNDLDPSSLKVGQDSQTGAYDIEFSMKGDAIGRLSKFTANNIGSYFTITLDRSVVSSPVIQSQLPGSGQITGRFTLDQAQQLVNVLKYGALPISFNIGSQESIGPTLG